MVWLRLEYTRLLAPLSPVLADRLHATPACDTGRTLTAALVLLQQALRCSASARVGYVSSLLQASKPTTC